MYLDSCIRLKSAVSTDRTHPGVSNVRRGDFQLIRRKHGRVTPEICEEADEQLERDQEK